ncbi:MAG: ATP synthase F1 subunit epsilon [Prevotella sp.]|uniref:ATP synthase F1 subunit epsilon n=1 Tax=Prevotella sp. TaxID=59823 RepID=UPI002A255FA6|nr:ATP synthase F1 subunit epsilon [Prevotella sp.]MDD7319223.1 ATP synthase F1 subunit epsilon [Prevotellaceae bacterium]MDY4020142.1 ATP synthase F1 subunit epsilon [Prevotella sp.]
MLKLKIVSPERVEFDGEVESVKVPGTVGEFEVLVHHAPIISSLERGTVTYRTSEGSKTLEVKDGFVSVKKNVVNICVEI